MTIPFWCVLIAAVIIYVAKLPAGLVMAQEPGGYDNVHPRRQQMNLTGLGARSIGAHNNAIEGFPIFAAGVIIAHIGNGDAFWATVLAIAYVVIRVAYTALYLAGFSYVRSTVWFLGLLASLALYVLPAL